MRVEGVEIREWAEPGCRGVCVGEGVMETVGMGGERGMEEAGPEEEGPREAGATPVGAGFFVATEDRLRPTTCVCVCQCVCVLVCMCVYNRAHRCPLMQSNSICRICV